MPAIRPQNWVAAYESILKSTKEHFELIIVSPFPLIKELTGLTNIKHVVDFGSPVRATQIGITLAEAPYLFPNFCDDALFLENAIDENLAFLDSMGSAENNVVTCKYSESDGFSHPTRWNDDSYYTLVNSYPVNKTWVPNDWYVFNNPFWHRSYFESFGGYDCSFGATPISHADLALRAYLGGAVVKLSPIPIMKVDHGQNDHRPIEISQLYFDSPAFTHKHTNRLSPDKIKVDKDNWKNAQSLWEFRFQISNE